MSFLSKRFILTISAAIGAAMVVLGTASDAFSFSKEIVAYLQEHLGLPKGNIATALLVTGLIILIAIFILLIKMALRASSKTFTPAEEKRARKAYLNLMQKDISNRIKSSIHHARYVDLKLKESNAQVSTFHFTFQAMNEEEEKVIESINPLIEKKEFSILLLGAPGSGKTTTVLNCVDYFIGQSQQDETSALPILINLSKWRKSESLVNLFRGRQANESNKEELATMDLDDWVIKTTAGLKKAGLTKAIVRSWLQHEQIILFLDGLDEADESIRNVIVDKINAFVIEYPTISILVCSRIADYEALVNTSKVKLALDTAVTINPMTPQQITDYLRDAQVPELQELLDADEELKEMAKSPLDLSIMVLACRYTDLKAVIAQDTHSITRKRVVLFDAYVKAMIQREKQKRMSHSHLHDADFIRIPVADKKIASLYKYLGWIAALQSRKSMSTFSCNKIYEYLTEEESDDEQVLVHPKSYIQTVNAVLLWSSLCLLCLLFLNIYPIAILIALPFLITAGFFLICWFRLNQSSTATKGVRAVVLGVGWPVIAMLLSIIYLPVGVLFTLSDISIWVALSLFTIGYIAIAYGLSLIKKPKLGTAFKGIVWWKHLLHTTIIAAPLFFVAYYRGGNYSPWIFIYLLTALSFAQVVKVGTIERWMVAGIFAYGVSAAVAGLLVFKDVGIVIFLLLLVAMAVGLQIFSVRNFRFPALGIFVGAFAGVVTILFVHPLIALAIASVLAAILWFCCERWESGLYERILNFIGSWIILFRLKLKRQLPWLFSGLLHYSTRALLLKRSHSEFEFIHRRIRDYFAIRQYLPQLENASANNRALAVTQIRQLNDASCDVLLEMIDDNEKNIRMACLDGLGKIGTVVAAKTLLAAISQTSGELQETAIEKIREIKDIGAVPLLLQLLNKHPADSAIFRSSMYALTFKLRRLGAWDNEEKLKHFIAQTNDHELILMIRHFLSSDKKLGTPKTRVDILLENIQDNTDINLESERALLSRLSSFSDAELKECMRERFVLLPIAFRLLFPKNPDYALRAVFDHDHLLMSLEILRKNKGIPLKALMEVVKKIIISNDQKYISPALKLLEKFPDKKMEPVLLSSLPEWEIPLKLEGLHALEKIATRKSIPLLLSYLYTTELSSTALTILSNFERDILIGLVKDEKNAGISDKIIPIIARKRRSKTISLLMELLNQNVPAIKNASITSLGRLKVRRAQRPLLQMFHEGDPFYLDSLCSALADLGETSIVPQLPGLFWQYPELRPTVLSALFKMKANTEILILYKDLLKTGFGKSNELQLNLAAYFAIEGNYDLVVDLIYNHVSPEENGDTKSTMPEDISPVYTLWNSILSNKKELDNSLSYDRRDNNTIRRNFIEKGVLAVKSEEGIYQILGIRKEDRTILRIVNVYSSELARKVTLEYLTDNWKSISLVIIAQLPKTENREDKLLLMGIIGVFGLKGPDPALQAYLTGNEDDLAMMALLALGCMKNPELPEVLIRYLWSSNKEVAVAALWAIAYNCELESTKISNLLQLIYEIDFMQRLLIRPPYSIILQKLPLEDLLLLSKREEANFRYLATIYISILGHGKAIDRLKELLEDTTPITVSSEHGHKTVSEGAFYALNKIGTPTAKALMDGWQKR